MADMIDPVAAAMSSLSADISAPKQPQAMVPQEPVNKPLAPGAVEVAIPPAEGAPALPADPVQAAMGSLRADISAPKNGEPALPQSDPKYIAQEGIKGAMSLPSMVATGQYADNYASQQSTNWLLNKFGLGTPVPDPIVPAAPAEVAKGAMGGEYDPSSAVGRYGGAVARGVGEAIPMAATGMIGPAVGAGMAVVGPLVGQGARDVTKAAGGGELAQGVADFAGNVVGGGLGTAGITKAGEKLAGTALADNAVGRAIFGEPKPTYTPPTAADLLRENGYDVNPTMQHNIEMNDKFSQTPMGRFNRDAEGLSNSLVPEDMGYDPITPRTIGETLMERGRTYLDNAQKTASDNFAKFDQMVPPTTKGETATIDQLIGNQSPGAPPPHPIYGQIQDAIKQNGGLSYNDLKAWRTQVGKMNNWDQVGNGGIHSGSLTPLYDALTNDMTQTIAKTAKDPVKAITAFRDMNDSYASARQFIDDRLGKLADKNLTPEQVFSSLASNPSKTVSGLQDMLVKGVITHEDLDMIAHNQLNQMGRDSSGVWNPVQFSKNAEKMDRASPEARDLLFRRDQSGANASITDGTNTAFDILKMNADRLAQAQKTLVNKEGPSKIAGFVTGLFKKGAGVAVGSMAGHVFPGLGEGVGEMAGAMMFGGHASQAAPVGDALYRLGSQPWFGRVLDKTAQSPGRTAALLTAQAKMQPAFAADLKTLADAVNANSE